jgi:transposase InsO family protein
MASSLRRSYHSDFIAAAKAGVLPAHLYSRIPKSTRHGFRRRDLSSLVTLGDDQVLALIKELHALRDSKRTLSILSAVIRISDLVRSLGISFSAIPRVRRPDLRRKILDLVNRLSIKLPKDKVLSLLGLSHSRFSSWSRNILPCRSSPLSLCRRSYPNQLTKDEVRSIKSAFSDPADFHHPAGSVAWKLINSGTVSANAATIVRYAKLMNLTAARKPPHKSRKRGSLCTSRPNETWHQDITLVTTADNRKAFVQLLVDNYSRKILAWKTSPSSADINTTELLKEAFSAMAKAPTQDILLLVDGGSENSNRRVDAYLHTVPISKLIAQVDVSFSNSMIEAVNKTLKYRYLFRNAIADLGRLQEVLKESVADYNARPKQCLNRLSSDDAHVGVAFDKNAYTE